MRTQAFQKWYEGAKPHQAAYCALIFSAGWQAAQSEGANKKFIPWLEVLTPTRDIGDALAGLNHWAAITDTALITTKLAGDSVSYLYSELAARKPPGMHIIGGIATSSVLLDKTKWDFADAAGWEAIAECAQRIAELTGQQIVLLENENALKPFHNGQSDIHPGWLVLALLALRNTGLQIWWNLPNVQSNSDECPDCRCRSAALTNVVAKAVPDSVFFGGYAMRPGRRTDPDERDRRAEMLGIVGPDRLLDRLVLTAGENPTCYSVKEAIVEAWTLPRGPVIVYPGAADWIRTGEQFAELMSPRIVEANAGACPAQPA